jgi:galactofuranosylgalactofuranosylrhamnosyl-N-acetylglucosaminyl-diphospho-decaprenol beta-1,5/1,6-galactofuranosyltransferase
MAEMVLQRVVMPPRRGLTRLYCRFDGEPPRPRKKGRRGVLLSCGTVLRTDTWFNGFFERYWREHAQVSEIALHLRISGAGALRLYRRSSRAATVREWSSPSLPYGRGSENRNELLQEIDFSGQDRELHLSLAGAPAAAGENGLLYFEIKARSPRLMIHQAEWIARKVVISPIRLVAGICTFNRVQMLISNIIALFADSDVADVLDRIIVVDQGGEKVSGHPAFAALARTAGGRLQLVEQENYGGAGGFTRCLLEAQSTGSATHILLMDDDIIPEPESVLRAAAFLSLARNDLAVGGHMLNSFRPCQLVETGSRYLPERVRINEPSRHCLDRAGDLLRFLEPRSQHYNGWWFFAFPLAVLDRSGLPLPLFLRGDDVEFGCRLMRQKVPTVSPPGIAVWHEPCERKGRGWHAFFELRNFLIVGALHFPIVSAATVARGFLSRLLDELLAYDYYESWLLCEAVAAYLCGPKALRHPPHAVQQRLQAMSDKLASKAQPLGEEQRAGSVSDGCSSVANASGSLLRAWRWWLVIRNLLLPSPSVKTRPRKLLHGSGEQWYDISCADVLAVVEPQHARIIVLRRSRGRFVRLLLRGTWLALRLLVGHRLAVRRWQANARALTSREFWMEHLRRPDTQQPYSEPRPSGSGCFRRSLTVAARTATTDIERGNHAQAQGSLL